MMREKRRKKTQRDKTVFMATNVSKVINENDYLHNTRHEYYIKHIFCIGITFILTLKFFYTGIKMPGTKNDLVHNEEGRRISG